MNGRVAGFEKIKADKNPAEHTSLQLTLEDGTRKVVDLGPAASMENIGLEEGDSVTVRGHEQSFQGRNVIVANLMRIEGEKLSSVSQ